MPFIKHEMSILKEIFVKNFENTQYIFYITRKSGAKEQLEYNSVICLSLYKFR